MSIQTDTLIADGRIEEIDGVDFPTGLFRTLHPPRRVRGSVVGSRPANQRTRDIRELRREDHERKLSDPDRPDLSGSYQPTKKPTNRRGRGPRGH